MSFQLLTFTLPLTRRPAKTPCVAYIKLFVFTFKTSSVDSSVVKKSPETLNTEHSAGDFIQCPLTEKKGKSAKNVDVTDEFLYFFLTVIGGFRLVFNEEGSAYL
jgi:hypothetical protein